MFKSIFKSIFKALPSFAFSDVSTVATSDFSVAFSVGATVAVSSSRTFLIKGTRGLLRIFAKVEVSVMAAKNRNVNLVILIGFGFEAGFADL